MGDFIDTELLILEVENRPALYDKNIEGYSDKNTKDTMWLEICEQVVPNWEKLSKDGKSKAGKCVQSKWKNVRDSFRKELKLQKEEGNKKRRKYLFFEQLSFLTPVMREISSGYCPRMDTPEEIDVEEIIEIKQENSNESSESFEKLTNGKEKQPTHEETCLPTSKESGSEEHDEDKYFLLSLLPTIRKLTPQRKMSLRIEYLQALQKAMDS